ncbi:nucleotide-diphospho-sugar transferase [Scenedesmus sp. NREL 46B-D3]|nr:nucleotide-diphospho-sugar transferase [Scenedesmus sp. NREL 46B-D3]
MQVLQQKAQSRAVAQEQRALPSFGSSLTGQRRVAAPVSHGKAAMRVGAKIQRPTSRNNMTIMNVLEKPTIQYTETSRAKSSSVLAIILGGGAGTRLYPLTKQRAKPAVPIGGAYRLIDVPMSNCINSGISKIYILTQFNSTSLNRHLARTYNMGSGVRFGGEGFVEVLAATQTPTEKEWFQGTADAVRQYAWLLTDTKNRNIEDVVILSGDHLYRMDYMQFVDYHRSSNADITIGCIAYDETRASDFGLMKIDENRKVLSFAEKPKGDELKAMRVDTTVLGLSKEEAEKKPFIASMGIYVFKKGVLADMLKEDKTGGKKFMDFGGEIIPFAAANNIKVNAYLFDGFWEDIGTIKSFFEENLKLAQQAAQFEFYDPASPIYTSPRFLPPAKIEDDCQVEEAIISHGCTVKRSSIKNAVVGLRSHISEGCSLLNTLIIGADYYESEDQVAKVLKQGGVPLGIGAGSKIKNCIVDKNARIGKNVLIENKGCIEELDKQEEGYMIRSGIVVILRNATIKDGTVI